MLVDDHAVVRMGFRLLLGNIADIDVIAEAASGEEACRVYAEARPDVVVLDLSMPGMGGLEALARIVAKDPHSKVLVLSAHEDSIHPARVLRAGAAGYLTKRSAPDALIGAIRDVAKGKAYLEPSVAQQLAMLRATGSASPIDALTAKEFNVFLALAQGRSVNDIAEAMSLAPSTVGTHLYNVKQKLGASNAAELALIAVRHGLVEP